MKSNARLHRLEREMERQARRNGVSSEEARYALFLRTISDEQIREILPFAQGAQDGTLTLAEQETFTGLFARLDNDYRKWCLS